jgi:nucleoside-triphosphatase THEP1
MNPWIAVVGRTRDGANEVVARIVAKCRAQGLRVGGVRQERIMRDDQRAGFDVVNLVDGERHSLAHVAPSLDARDICDLTFDSDALTAVRRWLTSPEIEVVLLPVGPLEARGRGHWPAIEAALLGTPRLLVLQIRPDVLTQVALQLDDPSGDLTLPANSEELERLFDTIVRTGMAQRSVT